MRTQNQAEILGISHKEQKILAALQEGLNTPLLISRHTKISRPGVYHILQSLKKRSLVESRVQLGKISWHIVSKQKLEKSLYEAKRMLLQIPEGREEIRGMDDAMVIVHRGKEAIRKLISEMLLEHKHERLLGTQGDVSEVGWDHIFTMDETARFNRAIKNNGIIVEAVYPEGWLERQVTQLGVDWAKEFEGRATRVNLTSPQYFAHGAQLWVFKDALYLIAMNEELVIEVRHSEIQKMILSFFKFMQDNSQVIDANAVLRALMGVQE